MSRPLSEHPSAAEPNDAEWTTATGLVARARRNPGTGAWCGYVAIDRGHPLASCGEGQLRVHGDVTFGGELEPGDEDRGRTWIGFDCMHLGDSRLDVLTGGWSPGTYRDLAFVRSECESLARQLVDERIVTMATEARSLELRAACVRGALRERAERVAGGEEPSFHGDHFE